MTRSRRGGRESRGGHGHTTFVRGDPRGRRGAAGPGRTGTGGRIARWTRRFRGTKGGHRRRARVSRAPARRGRTTRRRGGRGCAPRANERRRLEKPSAELCDGTAGRPRGDRSRDAAAAYRAERRDRRGRGERAKRERERRAPNARLGRVPGVRRVRGLDGRRRGGAGVRTSSLGVSARARVSGELRASRRRWRRWRRRFRSAKASGPASRPPPRASGWAIATTATRNRASRKDATRNRAREESGRARRRRRL